MSEDIDVINRAFFAFSGTSSVADMQQVAATASNEWNTHIAPLVSEELSLLNVIAEDLSASTAPVGEAPATHPGTLAFPSMGANVAFVLRFKIARRYRGGHPRWYQAGLTIGDLTDAQTWSTTFSDAFVAAYNAMVAAMQAEVYPAITLGDQQNVSYFEGFTNHMFPSGRVRPIPNPRPGGPITDVILSVEGNPKVCSQRRRTLQSS